MIGIQYIVRIVLENIHDIILQSRKSITIRRRIISRIEIIFIIIYQPIGKKFFLIHRNNGICRRCCIPTFPHQQKIRRRYDSKSFQLGRHRLQRNRQVYGIKDSYGIGTIETA